MTIPLCDLSSIKKHLSTHTELPAPKTKTLANNTIIIRTSNCKRRLKIIEALYKNGLRQVPTILYLKLQKCVPISLKCVATTDANIVNQAFETVYSWYSIMKHTLLLQRLKAQANKIIFDSPSKVDDDDYDDGHH